MATEDWQTRSRLTLIVAIIFSLIGLLVTLTVATMLLRRVGHRRPFIMTAMHGSISAAPLSSSRMEPTAAPIAQSGESAFESSADQATVSGGYTSTTKSFSLVAGSKFSIKNVSGSITVETWDQPKAEVRVVKRGPDRGTQIFFTNSANSLSIRTGVSGNNGQDVRYEIKLPRDMDRIDLKSVNGSVKLSNATGQIFVESANGSIELNDVVGVSKVQTVNGKINATLAGASDGPMEFVTANGRIDVTIKGDFDAELDASTIHGGINIDGQLGIPVQKQMVGQHARGQIGSGGPQLKLTATNGSVKLSRQQ